MPTPTPFVVTRRPLIRVALAVWATAICCGPLPAEEPFTPEWPMTQEDATEYQYQYAIENRMPMRQTNSIDMVLMLIPPGEFIMGSEETERAWAKAHAPDGWTDEQTAFHLAFEQPPHPVRITRPFLMSATEVTTGQFAAFVEATGYQTEAETDGRGGMYYDGDGGKQEGSAYTWRTPKAGVTAGPQDPVTQVTWRDAQAFCDWLSAKEGRQYRLPTEAEWEWAARAGSETPWFFGDDSAEAESFVVIGQQAPSPTGTKEPNGFGLFDVLGNVWEMTRDYADPGFYAISPTDDPTGPAAGTARTRRGGAYAMTPSAQLRTAYRKPHPENYRGLHVGFRVVAELPVRPPL